MNKHVTDWFPAGVRPERIGVYQCRGGRAGNSETYQYWNGSYWSMWSSTPRFAMTYKGTRSSRQNPSWRGLASNPSQSKEGK